MEVNELNRRLQPHIDRFTRIVQEDGEMNPNVITVNIYVPLGYQYIAMNLTFFFTEIKILHTTGFLRFF